MARFDNTFQTRLHSAFSKDRDATIAKLHYVTAGVPADEFNEIEQYADKTAAKLCNCGRYSAVFTCSKTGEAIISQARCKHRLCPRCNAIRANHVRESIEAIVKTIDSPRMLTLTVQSSDDPLKDQIKHLYDSYRRLRRTKAWKSKVKGGVAVCEITHNRKTGQWHPHVHVVIDGSYWRQADISKAWEIASNGSKIVDIRMIHKRSNAARYVSKYVTKIGETKGLEAMQVAELAEALHGLRLVQTCGTLHGITREAKHDERAEPMEYVAPIGPLANRASQGCTRSKRVYRTILLASRLKRAVDTNELHPIDQRRCRKAIGRLRDWWDRQAKGDTHGPPPKSDNQHRRRRPPDRPQRLWKEPEPTADALASGR